MNRVPLSRREAGTHHALAKREVPEKGEARGPTRCPRSCAPSGGPNGGEERAPRRTSSCARVPAASLPPGPRPRATSGPAACKLPLDPLGRRPALISRKQRAREHHNSAGQRRCDQLNPAAARPRYRPCLKRSRLAADGARVALRFEDHLARLPIAGGIIETMAKPTYRVRPETAILTRGFDPSLSVGAARPPVYRTSTFVFSSPEAARFS